MLAVLPLCCMCANNDAFAQDKIFMLKCSNQTQAASKLPKTIEETG